MYTLGGLMVSSDDDMRPYALMEHSLESLGDGEVSRGRLHRAGQNGYTRKSFDVVGSFLDVLGKPAAEVPDNYEKGELLVDTAMDLETNVSKGLARENSVVVERGAVPADAVVKMAQTFRSGTNDIDALDFADLFLANDEQVDPDELNELYVLVNFRPAVTNKNWRMDCGVAGYDNTFGLPPFFPTRLRFEDYIYRLWVQQPGVAAAHVDAAQNHTKSNYMRNPVAAEVFNEEVCNLLKRKIKDSVSRVDELAIAFDYDGRGDGGGRPARSSTRWRRCTAGPWRPPDRAAKPERAAALRLFAANLQKAFYAFEPDFFQQNLLRIVDDVVIDHQGLDRAVADAGRDLLLPEGPPRASADQGQESTEGLSPPAEPHSRFIDRSTASNRPHGTGFTGTAAVRLSRARSRTYIVSTHCVRSPALRRAATSACSALNCRASSISVSTRRRPPRAPPAPPGTPATYSNRARSLTATSSTVIG